jgi:hypothetical protein
MGASALPLAVLVVVATALVCLVRPACSVPVGKQVATEVELQAALRMPGIAHIVVTRPLSMSMAAWPTEGDAKLVLDHDVTITSTGHGEVLDFDHLGHRLQLRPNVSLTFKDIILRGLRLFELYYMDFIDQAAGSRVAWIGVVVEHDLCPPIDAYASVVSHWQLHNGLPGEPSLVLCVC